MGQLEPLFVTSGQFSSALGAQLVRAALSRSLDPVEQHQHPTKQHGDDGRRKYNVQAVGGISTGEVRLDGIDPLTGTAELGKQVTKHDELVRSPAAKRRWCS
ncbi:MAG: hypothetical protein GY778_25930 [bacterium]|nr:hypothetical protein [bacterium]